MLILKNSCVVREGVLQYLCCSCRGCLGPRGQDYGKRGCGRFAHRKQESCDSLETTAPSARDPSALCERHTSCEGLRGENKRFLHSSSLTSWCCHQELSCVLFCPAFVFQSPQNTRRKKIFWPEFIWNQLLA